MGLQSPCIGNPNCQEAVQDGSTYPRYGNRNPQTAQRSVGRAFSLTENECNDGKYYGKPDADQPQVHHDLNIAHGTSLHITCAFEYTLG